MKTRTLKFNSLLFLLLIGITFSSCSSDDDAAEVAILNQVNLIQVPDGATDVELRPTFSWSAATDPKGGEVSYDLYLDTNNPPETKIASDVSKTTHAHQDDLDFKTTYYWMVMAKDTNGNTTKSSISSFIARDINATDLTGKWLVKSIIGSPELTDCEKRSSFVFSINSGVRIETFFDKSIFSCRSDLKHGDLRFLEDGSNKFKISYKDDFDIWEVESLTETELVLLDTGKHKRGSSAEKLYVLKKE